MVSAHRASLLSSIHEKDKGGTMNAGWEEKLMNKGHHRKDRYSNGKND